MDSGRAPDVFALWASDPWYLLPRVLMSARPALHAAMLDICASPHPAPPFLHILRRAAAPGLRSSLPALASLAHLASKDHRFFGVLSEAKHVEDLLGAAFEAATSADAAPPAVPIVCCRESTTESASSQPNSNSNRQLWG